MKQDIDKLNDYFCEIVKNDVNFAFDASQFTSNIVNVEVFKNMSISTLLNMVEIEYRFTIRESNEPH